MTVSPKKAPCLIYPMKPREPQIKYTDYSIFSCSISWNLYDPCWDSCLYL